jgi:hypothetical protein
LWLLGGNSATSGLKTGSRGWKSIKSRLGVVADRKLKMFKILNGNAKSPDWKSSMFLVEEL